ncbi:unnamed protein product, partial [Discosporangium mesarthrocarpum]
QGDKLAGVVAASKALDETRVLALEAHLHEHLSHVEGWLLLAMHRLPRTRQSATAVLDALVEISSVEKQYVDDAPLRPSLRTLVQGLE